MHAHGSMSARVTSSVWRGSSTRLTLAVDGLPDLLVDGLPDLLVDADVSGRVDHPAESRVGVRFGEPAGVLVEAGGVRR